MPRSLSSCDTPAFVRLLTTCRTAATTFRTRLTKAWVSLLLGAGAASSHVPAVQGGAAIAHRGSSGLSRRIAAAFAGGRSEQLSEGVTPRTLSIWCLQTARGMR
jgi:hypothetical protein